jgi:MacB-like periplasmic core domain
MMTFAGRGEPIQLAGQAVSASFLDVLGVRPVLGRTFRQEEDFPNRNNVALVSYALWQSRFGGSAAAMGERITIDGFPFTVVAAAIGLTRFLSTQLYGVKPTDSLTFAAVAVALIVTALAASFPPARRASRIQPVTALRWE